jgi:zinc D-Ala-D-Ala carboxypeptidase
MTQLTPHFSLEEFVLSQTAARKNLPNMPPFGSPERASLQRLADTMEKVRDILNNHQILISSGYRSPKVNTAVGGSKNSAHMRGLAADFTCPDFGTPVEICKALKPHMADLAIDQLIHEYVTWCHLGLSAGAPRQMALTIDHSGTRTGFG